MAYRASRAGRRPPAYSAGRLARRAQSALLAAVVAAAAGPAPACVGDCDGDGSVGIDEVVLGVSVALGLRPLAGCLLLDRSGSGAVEIDEVISAVGSALNGCPSLPTPTPPEPTSTASAVPTPTETTSSCAPPAETPGPASACVPTPGTFVDCWQTSGLSIGRFEEGESGAAVADVDGDGFPDVFLWNGSGGAGLFRNLGHDMAFALVEDSGLLWLGSTTIVAAAFGDLDNDGRPDLVAVVDLTNAAYRCADLTSFQFNTFRIYRNLGGGRFADVSDAWGLDPVFPVPNDKPVGVGLSLVDLNLDGRLDIVEYRRDVEARPLAFLSQGDGSTWREAGRDVFGDGRGLTWNVFFTDSNRDQLLDVLILNDYWETEPSRYYLRHDRSLSYQQGELLPVFGQESFGSPMGAASADLNGDGELDLVVSDSGDQHVFSLGTDVGRAWGVSQNPSRFGIQQTCWSPAVLDLENDGIPDLFFACAGFRIGVPDRAASFVLHNGGGAFAVANGLLPDEEAPTWDEGLAVADFDQDGRVDLLTGGEEHRPRLLWNRIPGGQALAIRLQGRRANRDGIGARITVEAQGLPTQVREMFPGGATWGYGDAQLSFGLGQSSLAIVTVDWRSAGGAEVQQVELGPGRWVIAEP